MSLGNTFNKCWKKKLIAVMRMATLAVWLIDVVQRSSSPHRRVVVVATAVAAVERSRVLWMRSPGTGLSTDIADSYLYCSEVQTSRIHTCTAQKENRHEEHGYQYYYRSSTTTQKENNNNKNGDNWGLQWQWQLQL